MAKNTLAYVEVKLIMAIKRFIVEPLIAKMEEKREAPGASFIKPGRNKLVRFPNLVF